MEQCIKSISPRKKCGLFSSVFKKVIPNNNTLVDGLTQPLGIKTSHGIALTITKERQLKAKPILPHGKILRVIFPLFWFTKFILVLICA